MSEKTSRRIIIALSVGFLGTVVWLGLLYRNGGDTLGHLATTRAELNTAESRAEYLEDELRISTIRNSELKIEQSKSDTYQRQLEAESIKREEYISRLEIAEREGTEALKRIEDIARSSELLFEQGNDYIENGEE